ncbi:MAG TPA: alpha/beta fold hydrolase [Isosphaeraceae bacterium]|jgi:hypothetical protein
MRTPLLLSAVVLAGAVARADEAPRLEGTWEGLLKVNAAVELRLVLHVHRPGDGPLRATLDSPDQGAEGIPIDAIAVDKGAVSFASKTIGASFAGTLADSGDRIAGEFLQSGVPLPLTLARTDAPSAPPAELWEGKLKLPGGLELRTVVRITRRPDGTPRATFDSPDQGAAGLKVDAVTRDDKVLHYEIKSIGCRFDGTLDATGTEAVGTWTQGGASLPLTLKKVDTLSAVRRPQMPKRPYPYQEDAVSYENPAGGVHLAGTLTQPEGAGPFPAVLLISGSGPQDRDETLLGHKPFLVLADALTRRGIAVLRVDDRGVGGSSGRTMDSTSADFAGDALAGVEFLKRRKEIDPRHIGLIGHSEGGLVAPMVAARSRDVAFLVLLAGTALPGEQILEAQRALIMRAGGASEDDIRKANDLSRRLIAVVKAEPDDRAARAKMQALAQELLEALPEAERKALQGGESIQAQIAALSSAWFRYFLTYDPRPTLARVTCPVLALGGEKDLQVPPKENLAGIAAALKAAGNEAVTIRELPGLNHLFQTCRTGAPSEYAAIEETMAPEVLTIIGDWVRARTDVN